MTFYLAIAALVLLSGLCSWLIHAVHDLQFRVRWLEYRQEEPESRSELAEKVAQVCMKKTGSPDDIEG